MNLDDILARPGEKLTEHVEAVIDRLEQLERLLPLIQYPQLYDQLCLVAWLHDFGKVATGFQRQLYDKDRIWGYRHEVLSLTTLQWLPDELKTAWIAAIIVTHHKDLSFILDTYRKQKQLELKLVAEIQRGIAKAYYEWLRNKGVVLAEYKEPSAESIRSALDELESWHERFTDGTVEHMEFRQAILMRGLFMQADHAAAANVSLMGRVQIGEYDAPQSPFGHQRRIIHYARQSLLLIAPTGSGKTDAAIHWIETSDPPHLFYMLPYRVSMNAMYMRLSAVFGDIGIQHGQALLSLYHMLQEDGLSINESTQTAKERLKLARLHAYAVRIFSPYHLLRTMYRFKGYEASLVSYQDACVVVDEVHAYEPERLALILSSLAYIKAYFEAKILLMTATLPSLVESAIRDTLGELPRLTADAETYQSFQRHRISVADGDIEGNLNLPVERARNGEAVLIVCNTVKRARQISRLVKQAEIDTLTLHGRFTYRDRWKLEKELLRFFGTDGQRPEEPLIVVATQVIEVSLDVDFDCLFTDPAPVDALIQRFGRVNRTRRMADLARVTVFTKPTGADDRFSIYDPNLVQTTVDLLREYDGEPVNEAHIGEWLDRVYAVASDWQERFDEARGHFQRWVIDDLIPFESADVGLVKQFNSLMNECLVLPLGLEDDYLRLHKKNAIEADELFVPLSWWQYRMLEREGRAWTGERENKGMFYVDVPYDPLIGLQIHADEET